MAESPLHCEAAPIGPNIAADMTRHGACVSNRGKLSHVGRNRGSNGLDDGRDTDIERMGRSIHTQGDRRRDESVRAVITRAK